MSDLPHKKDGPTKVTQKNLLALPDGKHLIEKQLYLVVRRGGASRGYILRYTIHGARRDLSLGDPTVKTLAVVKQEAAKARALIAQGIDPKALRDEARAEERRKVPTLREYLPLAIEEMIRIKRLSEATRKTLGIYARVALTAPFADKRLDSISFEDVRAFFERIWEVRKSACHIRSLLERVFRLARRDGYMSENPARWVDGLDAYLAPASRVHTHTHHFALDVPTLRRAMLAGAERLGVVDVTCMLTCLTVCRKTELRLWESEEVDLDAKTFTVPPARRKDRVPLPHVVPLSAQAAALWKVLIDMNAQRICGEAQADAMKRLSGDRRATMHGIRATFRDWVAETGRDPLAAEKCLMHKTGSAVELAYQRSDLFERRRVLLQEWADEILPLEALEAALQKRAKGDPLN